MPIVLRKALDKLYVISGTVAAIALLALLLIVVLQMATRWMGVTFPGLTAYAGYCMGIASFFALGYALHEGSHIRVTLIQGHLGKHRKMVEIWCVGVSVVLGVLFSYFTIKTTYWSYLLGEVSQAQDATPIWIPQLSMSIGTVVLAIALIDLFIELLVPGSKRPLAIEAQAQE